MRQRTYKGLVKSNLRRVLEVGCKRYNLNFDDLTVMSVERDPYRLDIPGKHRDGKWLGEVLNRLYGPAKRAHWRGLHYALVAHGKIRKPDGTLYRNNEKDWTWLHENAGKAARWLGYVPWERIIDQKNAPPIIHRKSKVEPQRYISIGLHVEIPDAAELEPSASAEGFVARQPHHFAIYGEKSSLEDAVLPIAEEIEADLYLAGGELSETLIYRMARDANDDGRPLVVFTLTDCDPAGWEMPANIARKLQALRDLYFSSLRFEVVPVALTPEQVMELGLPSTPLKDGERRADRWRDEHGVDQTEIDALTTPENEHVLQQILRDAVGQYIDPTLAERVAQAEDEWDDAAAEAIADQTDPEVIELIRADAEVRIEELREEIDRINDSLNLTADHFRLPRINVPQPVVALDPDRKALVRFDDTWIDATLALKRHKDYGR